MTKAEQVFTDIYARKVWGSGSGGGSYPEQLEEYLELLRRMIRAWKPKTVLDIGCGVGWTAPLVDWMGAHYIGIDVVDEVLESAVRAWQGNCQATFFKRDAIEEPLPGADMVILKEITQHLDNASILKLLAKIGPTSRLVLHTTAVTGRMQNEDIAMGETRGVDLWRQPFNKAIVNVGHYRIGSVDYLCQLWVPPEGR